MIRRAWYVACDRCGGRPADISTEGVKDARRIAHTEGYVRNPGEDVCGPCSGKVWDGVYWRYPVPAD